MVVIRLSVVVNDGGLELNIVRGGVDRCDGGDEDCCGLRGGEVVNVGDSVALVAGAGVVGIGSRGKGGVWLGCWAGVVLVDFWGGRVEVGWGGEVVEVNGGRIKACLGSGRP